MKKVIILIAAVCLVQMTALSQTKFGHINSQELLQDMPERTVAEKDMAAFRTQLDGRIQDMQSNYQAKIANFQALDPATPQSTVEDMRNEILTLEGRIRDFQINAEEDMIAKNQELLQPMLQRLQDAITAVGKENGFTYIFDTAQGFIVYEDGEDCGPLVKAKLGL